LNAIKASTHWKREILEGRKRNPEGVPTSEAEEMEHRTSLSHADIKYVAGLDAGTSEEQDSPNDSHPMPTIDMESKEILPYELGLQKETPAMLNKVHSQTDDPPNSLYHGEPKSEP
jgi:hypothetical protein